ncbi:MAG: right-handed parallel beta-helix repeat-containing protein [Candidatus Paceibacterota bacterium]|jgi:hypothetical protein
MRNFKICSLLFAGLFFLSFLFPFNRVFAQTDISLGDDADDYHISEDTIWTRDNSPYVIYKDIFIDSGATLTIEPGTVIKFEDYSDLNISGKIVANGALGEEIYFTSLYDDSVGGDTDGYDSDWTPMYSSWGGIKVLDGGSYEINNTKISYANLALESDSGTGLLESVTITDCVDGLSLSESTVSIKNSNILNLSRDAITAISTSTVSIESSNVKNISGYGFGIYEGSSLVFSNSSLEDISKEAFCILRSSSIKIYNSTIKNIDGYNTTEIYDNGFVEISNSDIENVRNLFEVSNNSSISIVSTDIENTEEVFGISEDSSMNMYNSRIEGVLNNSNSAVVYAFNNSSINIASSSFNNITADLVIEIFNGSSLSFSDSSVKNILAGSAYGGVFNIFSGDYEYATTTLNIANSVISDGNTTAVEIFGKVEANIENTEIKNFLGDGILTSDNSIIKISGSEISGNNNGIENFGANANIDIENSIIKDNTLYGIYNDASYFDTYIGRTGYYQIWVEVPTAPIKAVGNWWGDVSGPFNLLTNASGTANQISKNVEYKPWLTVDPSKKRNPVIIIPGIMGTQLSKDYDDNSQIWPNISKLILSFFDEFLNDLSFNSDGTENPAFPMKVGDILRKVDLVGRTVSNTFDGLISTLTSDGYVEGTDLFVFPYDWRKSNAESAILLKEKIDEVISETGSSRVEIIAHSMGGLVTQKYVADNGADKVDKIFFIGTPHLGSPKAFKALMYGDDMGMSIISGNVHLLSQPRLKFISQNFPSVFDLLPSRAYVDGDSSKGNSVPNEYIYDTTSGSSKWLDYDETKDFMISHGINSALFLQAEDLHEDIDNFDLKDTDVYNFSGCGLTKTIGSITAKKKKTWTSLWQETVDDYNIDYVNGDGTVPLYSAVGPFGDHNYYVKEAIHSELPSTSGVPETIFSILTGDDTSILSNISTSTGFCDITGRVISTHSSVVLDIYDNVGNHTGPTDTGDIEYNISGVSYDRISDNTFAFLPDNTQNYRILIKPIENVPSYDLSVEEIGSNDTKVRKTYWHRVPIKDISSNSQIYISSTSTEYIIQEDENNDGLFETASSPSVETVASSTYSISDLLPPETTSSISANGTVSLMSVDDNTGVLSVEYSLDGKSWIPYTEPFNASGKTVLFFSTDNVGNTELIQEIKIPTPTARRGSRKNLVTDDTEASSATSTPVIASDNAIVRSEDQVSNQLSQSTTSFIQNTQLVSSSSLQDLSVLPPTTKTTKQKTILRISQVSISSSTPALTIKATSSGMNFTASVANSGVNIKSTITNLFKGFWSHLFLFIKKIL